ncbi:hypothetical protein NG798_16620 [Ancylothrix sp. C2]|uniref:hypothetical protein n=1 Tax=Ancylothrix sp. D3o TaxID=2953691 RepID=UPI0021BA477E|nr:hypothetical protein [Ancylothrix sp. D3o]MCT7951427.1 hypothetical protein [Ancylothrix sp. D3o]
MKSVNRESAFTTNSDTQEKARVLMADNLRASHNRQRSLLRRSAEEIGVDL